ncbi:MAG: phosphoribosylaminoimidazolesuccinocarboxamide synthase [Elusimicrobia bacterium]|nr:phosphoribosylaminoimidazolesuccinocarboxamide synthase [Elusimicrobiota bacterium]
MKTPTLEDGIKGLTLLRRGKVRDVYDLGERLLIVATDRISAFDHILPTAVPGKGQVLTQVSAFWFRKTAPLLPNHLISADLAEIRRELPAQVRLGDEFAGRVTLARKARRVDAECVVRGYLAGSGWKEYLKTGAVCGHRLPAGLREAERLPEPIFTPSTKAEEGHDENITRGRLADLVGADTARQLEAAALKLYGFGADFLAPRGVILADTKFEFGFLGGTLIVIDEMLTPDSSRLWPAASYRPGSSPESFDKQFVRDHLERVRWDKASPAPALPAEVVAGTAQRYEEFLRIVTG